MLRRKLVSSAMQKASIIAATVLLAACGKSSEPVGLKQGTTMDDLKAQSAAIARQQDEAASAASAKDTRTALSRKAAGVTMGMPRASVIALLGSPSNVIAPQILQSKIMSAQETLTMFSLGTIQAATESKWYSAVMIASRAGIAENCARLSGRYPRDIPAPSQPTRDTAAQTVLD